MSGTSIVLVSPSSDAAALMLGAVDAEFLSRYPEFPAENLESDCTPGQDLVPPRGCFLVAFSDGDPAGCIGLMHNPCGGEIKRMFVAAHARRQGIARALIESVEEHARTLGYTRIVVETGPRNSEALQLYPSCGYVSIAPYAPHDDSSVCFAKELTDPVGRHQDGL
jgi:putative acetyltransferase